MFRVLHTTPEAFLNTTDKNEVRRFLRLRDEHDVSVVESTATAFEHLRRYLTPERVTADKQRFADLDEPFPQEELDAVAHLLTEFNAINVNAMDSYSQAKDKAKLYQRKTAVASQLRLVLELYAAAMRCVEKEHRGVKNAMPKNIRDDIARFTEGKRFRDPEAVAVYFGVGLGQIEDTVGSYVAAARSTLWLEETG